MRLSFSFLLIILSIIPVHGEAAENCFLQNYIQERASVRESQGIPTREVLFAVPVPGDSSITVTRLLSSPSSSPRLKELFAFTSENRIILTKGDAPRIPGEDQATTYIGIPESAMKSEEALTNHIEAALISYTNVPLNLERLPEQSRRLVMQMRDKHNTTFVHSRSDQGFSLDKENTVAIKTRHVDNLRVNDVVVHEITHTTTDRKVIESFNPVAGKAPQPFTEALAGREMSFKSKYGKTLNHPIEGYEKYYRSDEIEAHIREMAQAKKDGQDLTKQLQDTNAFINAEETHIRSLLRKNGNDLTIVHGEAENALRAGRRQRRIVTGPDGDFELSILVPRGLDRNGEREFIASALKRRLETLNGYRSGLQRFERDGVRDLHRENPDLQIEAPEAIGVTSAPAPSPTSIGARLRAAGFERDLTEPSPGNTNFSQVIAGSVPNQDGGRSLIVRRSRNDFSEIHDLDNGIYRGDPLWVIDGAGEKAADFFGVKAEKRSLAAIPDADRANISIGKFNSGLPEGQQIPLRYYRPGVDRVSPREYIDRFIRTGELPIANNGTEALHDVIFHYFPLLYMPPKLLTLHRQQMKLMLEFQDFIKTKHPDLYDDISLKVEIGGSDAAVKLEHTEARVSGIVDSFTSEPLMAFEKFRNERYADSGSPGTFKRGTTMMNEYLYGGASPVDVIRGILKTDKPEGTAALEEFLRQIPASNRGAREGLSISPDTIEKDVLERIRFVNERAQNLKSERP